MVHIFFNPLANNKNGLESEKILKETFKSNEVTFMDITEVKDVKSLVKEFSEDDTIVLAGGDGTLSRFVNDIYDLKIKQKFLYYPCGSGNDFFNDVKDSAVYENGLIVMNEYIKSLPKVFVNGKESCFINGIGFGIDGYCCEEGDKIRAASTKKVNYTAIAIKGVFGGYKPYNGVVKVDGVSTKDYKKVWLAPSMIGRYYGGGMMVTPMQNRLNDEKKLTCAVAHKAGILKILSVFPKIFKGTHVSHKEIIDFYSGHEIEVMFDKPCALQIDGETISNVKSYKVFYN